MMPYEFLVTTGLCMRTTCPLHLLLFKGIKYFSSGYVKHVNFLYWKSLLTNLVSSLLLYTAIVLCGT